MAIKIDEKDLENALSRRDNVRESPRENSGPRMSQEEEIGFHKGALNTLVAERNEIIKMVQNVEAIMQAHIKRLEELGVKLQTDK